MCFLDDITGKNVLIEGDPLYWLALTYVGLVCDTATEFSPRS